jgi:hypothetical protein
MLKNYFSNFKAGIKNLIKWFPTIWNDRDWDRSFITEILIRKLEFTRDYHLSDKAYSTETSEIAEEIQEAIDKLHMTSDSWEFYDNPAFEEFQEKWGKQTFTFEPVFESTDDKYFKTKHENVKTLEEEEQCLKDFVKVLEQSYKDYTKDKKEAYLFIAKNIDKWWE